MHTNETTKLLGRIGIRAESTEDPQIVKMTMGQYGKLQKIMPAPQSQFESLEPANNRVVVRIDLDALEAAVAANKKAPRRSVSVSISSFTIYEIDADEDAANEVSRAMWNSGDDLGYIEINGERFEIFSAEAQEFYEISEDSDPARKVFVVELPGPDGTITLTSYGVTNLIRRIVALSEYIG